jgi:hypothetical protein
VPTGTATIIEDGGVHRLYYTALPIDYKSGAVSPISAQGGRDGITWVKPKLGLVEFRGSRDNNILMAGNTEDRSRTSHTLH